MKLFATLAVFAAAVHAVAITNDNFNLVAGQTYTITFNDATGPVTIALRNGDSKDLGTVLTITSNAPSTNGVGSYAWLVPSTLSAPGPYAFSIVDNGSNDVNYSKQFAISGVVVGGSSPSSTPTSSMSKTSTTTTVTTSASMTPSSSSATAMSSSMTSTSSALSSMMASSSSMMSSSVASASPSATSSPHSISAAGINAVSSGAMAVLAAAVFFAMH